MKKTILALVATAIALLLAEISTRFFFPAPFSTQDVWPGFDGQLREGLFVPDAVVGYRPGPAWAPDGRFGFRNGAEYDGTSDDSTDIVLLGDSLIQDGKLGNAFKEQLTGKPARVWVAGIGGYNTLQEAYYLEHFVEREPDVLVLGFCLNDFCRSMTIVPRGSAGEGTFVAPDFEPLAAVNPLLFRRSALYRLIASARLSRTVRVQYTPESVRQNRGNVRRGLVQIQQYARRREIPLFVILYPHLVDQETQWLREARQQARALFAELGLRWIDLTDDYAARGPLALRVRSDDEIHPNSEGHAIAARRLLGAFPEAFPP